MLDTWERIDEANRAAGWYVPLTLAERDQIEAWADELTASCSGIYDARRAPTCATGRQSGAGRSAFLTCAMKAID